MGLSYFVEDVVFSACWKSIDYLYVTIQNLWMYDFSVHFYSVADFLRENDYIFFYELLFAAAYAFSGFELFMSSLYDSYLKDFVLMIDENEVRRYLASLDYTLFYIYHPEFAGYRRVEHSNFFFNCCSNFYPFIYDNVHAYSLTAPCCMVLQIIILLFSALMFLSFFFSFFNNSNKEEWAADTDYAVSNMSIEAEKEIFAADDAVYLFLSLLFFFGTYFGFLVFGLAIYVNDASFFFWSLPMFGVCLLLMPVNLLSDFGLLFALYLRGSSNTASFFAELSYDYIGIIAFFTRLVVQFVRLILMFVVYCMMHDAVMLQLVSHWFMPISDNLFDDIMNLHFNSKEISYFILFVVPSHLFHWAYEVVHTFFVVTAQFAAFFTIAIWLFLLFYTFFVYEKYECHFINLRNTRKAMWAEFKNLYFRK